MSYAVETLTKARALIATPEKWTQGVYARNEADHSVYHGSPEACKRCVQGAILGIVGAFHESITLVEALDRATPGGNAIKFNDAATTTHADILALFDRAIQMAAEAER